MRYVEIQLLPVIIQFLLQEEERRKGLYSKYVFTYTSIFNHQYCEKKNKEVLVNLLTNCFNHTSICASMENIGHKRFCTTDWLAISV